MPVGHEDLRESTVYRNENSERFSKLLTWLLNLLLEIGL